MALDSGEALSGHQRAGRFSNLGSGVLRLTETWTEEIQVPIRIGLSVRGYWTEPASRIEGPGWTFAYAPGAGSNVDCPFGQFLSEALPALGIPLLRFQFPYMQGLEPYPGSWDTLEATWVSAIEVARARREGSRLAIGGRSLGGRSAAYTVAWGEPVDALVCFAYPLHPVGKPEETLEPHLPLIDVPMLVNSGTRDGYGTPEELRDALAVVENCHPNLLEGADHQFRPTESSGRTREDVWREVTDYTVRWLKALPTV